MNSKLLSAAVAGIVLGLGTVAHAQTAFTGHGQGSQIEVNASSIALDAPPSGKHACKGQNSCKGQGGCKSDQNACRGQNACKGQGGCKTDGSM